MEIICKHCNGTETIADHEIPSQSAADRCKCCDAPIPGAPLAIQEQNAPQASQPASAHDHPLLDAFPEMVNFSPARYALPAILRPDHEGHYRTGLNKMRVKILTAVKPTLDRLMRPGEQVVHIASGTAYYPIEMFFDNGMFTMLYSRYALVATNRRLVMVNTNHRMTRTRHYLFQIAYDNIRKVSRGLFRTSLAIVLKKGRRCLFTSMKTAFTTELQVFIESRLTPEEDQPYDEDVADYLCPACYSGLPAGHHQCSVCQAAFKTAGKAASRSLLLPGWGDLYLGHHVLGCLELTGSLLVWMIVFGLLVQGGLASIVPALVILVFYNGLDALLTYHMARKGYMLESPQTLIPSPAGLAMGQALQRFDPCGAESLSTNGTERSAQTVQKGAPGSTGSPNGAYA